MGTISTKSLLSRFEFRSRVDFETLRQAVADLRSGNQPEQTRMAIEAALYIFPDGEGIDEKNLHTFTALCNRNSIDPTRMARIVWGVLRPERKEMILKELLARGYHLPLPTPIKRVNGFALRG